MVSSGMAWCGMVMFETDLGPRERIEGWRFFYDQPTIEDSVRAIYPEATDDVAAALAERVRSWFSVVLDETNIMIQGNEFWGPIGLTAEVLALKLATLEDDPVTLVVNRYRRYIGAGT